MSWKKHGRRFVVGGNIAIKMRLPRHRGQILDNLRDEYETRYFNESFFEGAPFRWVGLMIRYTHNDVPLVEYGKISGDDQFLDLTIELDGRRLIGQDRATCEAILREVFDRAVAAAEARKQPDWQNPGTIEDYLDQHHPVPDPVTLKRRGSEK